MSTGKELNKAFTLRQYLFRKKVLKIFGGAFHVYDDLGQCVFFSEQKAFKLKEDFRIYADETKTKELLNIKTPQILDIGATYTVMDSTTGEAVGALKRHGLKSILKDEWTLMDTGGQELGKLKESSTFGAIASRVIKLIPQNYAVSTTAGAQVATIKQHFNPFVLKYTMSIPESPAIDPRLLIAAGILMCSIEGRQK